MKKEAKSIRQNILILLEEPSAEELLKKFIPRFFPSLRCTYRHFAGVNNLLKRLEKTIRNHEDSSCPIVILCDQDEKDCVELKKIILGLCKKSGQYSRCAVRIACHELESWYLAQLDVVAQHFGVPELVRRQKNYQNPDNIGKPSEVMSRITKGNYQKIKGSRIMGEHLDSCVSRSRSFKCFVDTLKRFSELSSTK